MLEFYLRFRFVGIDLPIQNPQSSSRDLCTIAELLGMYCFHILAIHNVAFLHSSYTLYDIYL